MLRPVLLLLLTWGLLGIPSLCSAGALLHECECGASLGCGHEEACTDDPCRQVLGMPNPDSDQTPPPQPASDRIRPLLTPDQPRPADPAAPRNLPYPPGQRPLLI